MRSCACSCYARLLACSGVAKVVQGLAVRAENGGDFAAADGDDAKVLEEGLGVEVGHVDVLGEPVQRRAQGDQEEDVVWPQRVPLAADVVVEAREREAQVGTHDRRLEFAELGLAHGQDGELGHRRRHARPS